MRAPIIITFLMTIMCFLYCEVLNNKIIKINKTIEDQEITIFEQKRLLKSNQTDVEKCTNLSKAVNLRLDRMFHTNVTF